MVVDISLKWLQNAISATISKGGEMYNLIDLSQCIEDGMPVHPLDNKMSLIQNKTVADDGYNNSTINAGMHIGTHIDIPRHFFDVDEFVSQIPLEKFIGRGCIIDAEGHKNIVMKEEYRKLIKRGDIVLIYTGMGRSFYEENYYTNYPVIDKKLAEYFVEAGVKMVGMDMCSPDKEPFEIHDILLRNDIFIIENMTNLDKLIGREEFEIIAFPLKIKAEASMVRVVARILTSAPLSQR